MKKNEKKKQKKKQIDFLIFLRNNLSSQRTKTVMMIEQTMGCCAALAANYNIPLLTQLNTDD